MAQQRFFNWKEEDSTFLLSQRLSAFFVAGRYAGYDFTPTANMTLTLGSSVSGMTTRKITGSPYTVSVAQTNQGMTLFEDAPVTLPIGAVGGLPRIDLVVLTHSQTQNPGGALGLYSVVQGTPGASPVKPAIPTPDTQIEIGSLYLPASVTALNQVGVIWTQSKVSAMETKASNADISLLYTLSNDIIDALGKALSLQLTRTRDGYPVLPPILIYGGVDDQDFPYVNPGYIYFEGELLRILAENDVAGVGSLVVWDILGTTPFRTAKPRKSNIADGDFSDTELKLLYDFIVSATSGNWVNFNLANGWQTGVLGGVPYYPAQFKIQEGNIFLRGALVWETASPPSSMIFAEDFAGETIPFTASTKQPATRLEVAAAPVEPCYLMVNPANELSLESVIIGADQVFLLDGCVISLG